MMEELTHKRIGYLIIDGLSKRREPSAEYVDGLLEGLKLFREINTGYIGYAVVSDKFYGAGLHDLEDITESHIIRLGEYGWFFDPEGECFCTFI